MLRLFYETESTIKLHHSRNNIDEHWVQISTCNQHVSNCNGQMISTAPYDMNKIKVVKSPNTHIGPKFTTSNLNLHLPQPNNFNRRQSFRQGWFVAIGIIMVLLLFTYLIFVFIFQAHGEYNVSDDEYLPLDWYYDREYMGLPTCAQPNAEAAEVIVVDSMKVDCVNVETCIDIIRVLPDVSHFYLKHGHVFEGLGWNCCPGKQLKIVFLSEVPSLAEIYSYNMLLHVGRVDRLIAKNYQVFPICCVSEQLGPSMDVMNFLKTLVNFRDRDCIVKHPKCY